MANAGNQTLSSSIRISTMTAIFVPLLSDLRRDDGDITERERGCWVEDRGQSEREAASRESGHQGGQGGS